MIINKLLVRQINIHGVGRYNIFSLTELLYFSALGKAVRRGRGSVVDDEWCTGAPVHLMMVHLMSLLCTDLLHLTKNDAHIEDPTINRDVVFPCDPLIEGTFMEKS